ncbi:SIS domain-containing protein [Leadbettera azotonutricia]|uniref:3-hexulose-6-phosphate isomerase (6-phospho-3-hexuloisomerase) (PHI) n=1 Tax=Leadbettera azotonutricia (strain ATCC BAA-888 / DSM 13862 / ZAS-9) TaxID=545695 RepID=F5YAN9_LEAAZ|nr:SIS domain-containing protein [Leadbettera azotonutricia]AEF81856.1 3-hexulose-6-phosphate isomerase (6-phospho-3-hexuloisomerase) (PHI) [Leadbettera azotonutricia ZAS-9]
MSLAEDYSSLYKTILEEHRQVFEAQDIQMLRRFMDLIASHKRIFIMGAGREGIAARGFAMRLMHLGKDVHWIWDDTTPGMGKDDLFIVVNGGGNIGHINYVMSQAKQSGAHIACISGSPSGAGVKIADFILFVPAAVYKGTDPVTPSIQPMGNLFEQHLFLLFDVVIILLEKELKLSHEEMAARHRNVE